MTQQIITTAKKLEKPLTLYILTAIALLFVIMYIYFINGTVMHVVERNQAEVKIADISSEVSEIEYNYLSIKKSIDVAYANNIGFKEVGTENIFVSISNSIGNLSFNSGI